MKKRLLLTYATRPLGIRVANLMAPDFEVLAATAEDIPSVFIDKYIPCPAVQSASYVHEMLTLALDHHVAYILPLGLKEIAALGRSMALFEEYGIQVLCPDMEILPSLSILSNPPKALPLHLMANGKDLLEQGLAGPSISNGLGVFSDSGEEFLLTAIQD
ncbi:hypothetical protein ACL9RF_16925 [Sphingobacterium sp. Mn56C]|uniref:hypothetical protein n=1 Tax=Sphingobacterium sp. Mn56C TaxID=3395261 RepID=UPI003BC0E54D